MMTEDICYEVGALLYSPALNEDLAASVINERFGGQYSLALCLEDTVADGCVERAEKQLVRTVTEIMSASDEKDFYLPKIFIRVREPDQLLRVHASLGDAKKIITGYIFPKYTVSCMDEYNRDLMTINTEPGHRFYMMPTIESRDVADPATRSGTLAAIKASLDKMKEYVLNVRVGGNDLCNEFSVRRHYDETIYDILPIAGVLADILTVFSRDYVVSGPVWEFYSSDNNEWRDGLKKETARDRLNGFVGKTVIHPKQIEVVNEAFRVSKKDYGDALAILGWDDTDGLRVGGSVGGERMNEVKTHMNWAEKTVKLARIYGIS